MEKEIIGIIQNNVMVGFGIMTFYLNGEGYFTTGWRYPKNGQKIKCKKGNHIGDWNGTKFQGVEILPLQS